MKLLLLLIACISGPDFETAVLYLSGASTMEELDESVLDRYRTLEAHPLELNLSSRSKMLASGLMSAFQVASLIDTRERSGDILSYTELALIDGFGQQYAEALKPFTRLNSSGPPGKRYSRKLKQTMMLRGALKTSGDGAPQYSAGIKYKAAVGESAEAYFSLRNSYSNPGFGPATLSGAYYGRKSLGKLVLGHYNARFGQGLIMWSGFSLQPWSSVQSFRRNGSGFSASGSFSQSHCGVAADFDIKRWTLAAAYSFPEKMPMGSLSYTGRKFSLGLNAMRGAISTDFKVGFPGVSLWGELAWRGSLAAVAGLIWIPNYGSKAGVMGRWIENVPELVAGYASNSLETVVYASSKQKRLLFKYSPSFNAGSWTFAPALRLAATKRDKWKYESRGEMRAGFREWEAKCRLDVVYCNKTSWLFYAEGGKGGGALRCWLRWTLFKVEDWDGRIYVYERDAPGAFNVPAYYGKGWSVSFTGAWRPGRRHGFYFRLSCLEYPWMTERKDPKYEVKLQYQLSL